MNKRTLWGAAIGGAIGYVVFETFVSDDTIALGDIRTGNLSDQADAVLQANARRRYQTIALGTLAGIVASKVVR